MTAPWRARTSKVTKTPHPCRGPGRRWTRGASRTAGVTERSYVIARAARLWAPRRELASALLAGLHGLAGPRGVGVEAELAVEGHAHVPPRAHDVRDALGSAEDRPSHVVVAQDPSRRVAHEREREVEALPEAVVQV